MGEEEGGYEKNMDEDGRERERERQYVSVCGILAWGLGSGLGWFHNEHIERLSPL